MSFWNAYNYWNKMLTKAEQKLKEPNIPFVFQVGNSFKMKQLTQEQHDELIKRYYALKEKIFYKRYGFTREEIEKMSKKEQLELFQLFMN